WSHLHRVWKVAMESARSDWWTLSKPRRKVPDRANYEAMVASGAPPYLGFGYGDSQARRHGVCMFGAKVLLPSDTTLAALAEDVEQLAHLVANMAAVQPLS